MGYRSPHSLHFRALAALLVFSVSAVTLSSRLVICNFLLFTKQTFQRVMCEPVAGTKKPAYLLSDKGVENRSKPCPRRVTAPIYKFPYLALAWYQAAPE